MSNTFPVSGIASSCVPAQQALLADVQGEIAELVERARAGHERGSLTAIRTNQNFSAIGQGFFHGFRSTVTSETWGARVTRMTH